MTIQETIDFLKNYNFQSRNYKAIEDHFVGIGNHIPAVLGGLDANRAVYRCRKLPSPSQYYHFPIDVSYRRDLEFIKGFGRANVPHASKFYGSIAVPGMEQGYATAMYETSKLLRRDKQGVVRYNGVETYQLGMWRMKSPLTIMPIIPSPDHVEFSEGNKELYQVFEELSNRHSLTQEQRELIFLLGDQFAKVVEQGQDIQYSISAIFSAIVLSDPRIDGIGYPSVQSESKGYNIVLNPQTVENKLVPEAFSIWDIITVDKRSLITHSYVAEMSDGVPLKWRASEEPKPDFKGVLKIFKDQGVSESRFCEMLFNQYLNGGPYHISE